MIRRPLKLVLFGFLLAAVYGAWLRAVPREREGRVHYRDCRTVVNLGSSRPRWDFRTYTCTWFERPGQRTCVHVETNSAGACESARVYIVTPAEDDLGRALGYSR